MVNSTHRLTIILRRSYGQAPNREAGGAMEREPVEGRCAACGQEQLQRYPVLSEGGWFMAVKCQACLASAGRERWNRLGHVVRMEDLL